VSLVLDMLVAKIFVDRRFSLEHRQLSD
jgi:hypothetical protein